LSLRVPWPILIGCTHSWRRKIRPPPGAVPFLGDAFDVLFRANRRNIRILRDYLRRQRLI